MNSTIPENYLENWVVFFYYEWKNYRFLSAKNPVTNQLTLVFIVTDKLTKLHRTIQITCLIIIIRVIQACIMISSCGTSHNGGSRAKKKVKSALKNFHINLESQLNGMSFDGQYFATSVDKKMQSFCWDINHEFFFPMWDIAHRL